MDAENPEKKKIEYIQGPPKTGKTVRALTQAHNYASHGWLALFVTCDNTIQDLYNMMSEAGIPPNDLVTFAYVQKEPGFVGKVIDLCQKKHPDILVLDGGQPGVNELRLLNAAAKSLNMLVIVTQRPSPTLK